jgi:hypothetical protein
MTISKGHHLISAHHSFILLLILSLLSSSFLLRLNDTAEWSGFRGQVEYTAKDGRYDNERNETSLNEEVDDRVWLSAKIRHENIITYT